MTRFRLPSTCLVVAAIMVLAFMAACAQTPQTPTASAAPTAAPARTPTTTGVPVPTPTSAAASPTPRPVTPTATSGGVLPRRGGIVTTSGTDPPSLDITRSNTASLQGAISPVYNKLLRNKPTYFESIEIEPDLAEGWTVSPDGLSYTFKLRKGVRWQNLPPVNGREFTSADVVWTVNWILDPKRNTYLREHYATVKSIEALDPYSVVFRLTRVDPEFLFNQAHGFNKMLAREVFEKDGNFATVVGTGAWIFDKWDSGVSVKLKRNPDYFKMGLDGKPKPYLDGWEIVIIADATTRDTAMRTGKLDYGPGDTGVELINLETMKKSMTNYSWQVGWRGNARYIWWNNAVKPLDDVRVRQALHSAIPSQEIADVTPFKGYTRLQGFVPSAVPNYSLPNAEIEAWHKTDIEKAKQLLKEAGYEKGFSLIMPTSSAVDASIAAVVKDALSKVNIDIQVAALETVAAQSQFYAGQLKGITHRPGLTGYTPSFTLYDYYHSKGNKNWIHYNDPKYDAMADAFMVELDEAKRVAKAHEMQRYLMGTMPSMPVYYWAQYFAVNNRMQGYITHWTIGPLSLEDTWVTK